VNFLNVGPWELTIILIIAILVVGPRRMTELARQIGRATSQMRKLSNEFLGTIQAELETTEQETRPALDAIPDGVQAADQDTRYMLETVSEERQTVATSIRDELQALEHETRQAMKEITTSVQGIIKGEPEVTGERVAGSTEAKPEAEDDQDE
jgi:Sec-independent protein translocase protein TatA